MRQLPGQLPAYGPLFRIPHVSAPGCADVMRENVFAPLLSRSEPSSFAQPLARLELPRCRLWCRHAQSHCIDFASLILVDSCLGRLTFVQHRYDYLWRLDADVEMRLGIPCDVFDIMVRSRAVLGFVLPRPCTHIASVGSIISTRACGRTDDARIRIVARD